jgi:NAD(P)H-dependent flavin oxidoreductase YrpB (nitropropane dioxygenase family)
MSRRVVSRNAVSPLAGLGIANPVIAAPMAGGPTVPAFVIAASSAGCLGFLAAGYKSAEQAAAQIAEVRDGTEIFGVNLFAPNPVPVDHVAYRRYADLLQQVADHYGVDLASSEPLEDDDAWQAKVDLLVATPVPVVSFTFGVPDRSVVDALRGVGTLTVQTITSVDEVAAAEAAGVDALAVQSSAAGGHRGVLRPEQPTDDRSLTDLVTDIGRHTSLPVFAAGGISTPAQVAATLAAGAVGVMVGTVLLLSDESGASATHRAALAEGSRDTVVTRAFTGRPARGLRNEFIDRFDGVAPFGYPALHHLTSPLRKASAEAGDPEQVNLWAGTGYRDATVGPLGVILDRLAGRA